MPKATRSRTKHFAVGQPAPLSHQRLPTKGEALSYVRCIGANSGVSRRLKRGRPTPFNGAHFCPGGLTNLSCFFSSTECLISY